MKKQARKVHLSRETLIRLASSELDRPAGGIAQRYTESCNAYSGCLTCQPCRLT